MTQATTDLFIGLMSGTSLDAIDTAIIDFTNDKLKLVATHEHELPEHLKKDILKLCYPGANAIQRMGETDSKLGHLFADSVNALLAAEQINPKTIKAIGSHGQTIRHMPDSQHPFTLQIGDPNIIAAKTGITTVADFRRRDMAMGGQAAPLAPAFHNFLFKNRDKNIGVLNIGGIANITLLPADKNQNIIGFDTGPGNGLMNSWCLAETGESFDKDGQWALSGKVDNDLLKRLLDDPYFKRSAPKSTGREYFHLDWLEQHFKKDIKPEDVQATLLELTAQSIIDATSNLSNLWVCGGGANNKALMQRLKELSSCPVNSIEDQGIHPDWVEAAAFAWLARQTLLGEPGNIPSVTGAKTSTILGGVYYS